MGVDVSAMCCIGKYVEDAESYLISKGLLKEGQLEEEYGGDIQEMGIGIEVQAVSYYSDEGYYVGYMYYGAGILQASKDIEELGEKFKSLTGDDAELEIFCQWH